MQTDMHPEDIKNAIRKRGSSLYALGRKAKLNVRVVSTALDVPHKAAEAVISEFLQIPAHHIWPSRYHPNGKRKLPQPSENYQRKPRIVTAEVAA